MGSERCCYPERNGGVHALMWAGFLEPITSGSLPGPRVSGNVHPAGWPREGQSQRPHGGLPEAVLARGAGLRQGQPPLRNAELGEEDGAVRTFPSFLFLHRLSKAEKQVNGCFPPMGNARAGAPLPSPGWLRGPHTDRGFPEMDG